MIHGRITHCMHKDTDIDRQHWQMGSDMSYMLDQIALLHQEYLEMKNYPKALLERVFNKKICVQLQSNVLP